MHDHDHHHNTEKPGTIRYKETRNVTLVGMVVNIFLSLAQLIGGTLAHSQALIADGVHTVSDLASDVVVLIAAKIASKDADDDHPYGHGRFETVATVILGLALAGVAVGIAISAFGRIMNPERLLQPEPLALLFAALAIVSKEGLYQYTMVVANRIDSKMLKANAWHHRSDAISSVLVAVGVAGSIFLEIPWLDAAAAIVVAVMIFYMGARLILDSTMELVDTALEPEKTAEIGAFINKIEGVDHMHMLRTRKMGNTVLADVHLQVNSYLSVSEGHYIAERVIHELRHEFPEMHDITVHIDPEDDETASPSKGLPSRNQIMAELYPLLKKFNIDQDISNIVLHYIDGKVEIEIFLNKSQNAQDLTSLIAACKSCKGVRSVTVNQKLM
jgi:cation diffusion facilitator family transporter